MIHDTALLDKLDSLPKITFDGQVFRATRKSLDPLATSRSGGRWMPASVASVLYTSMQREGALAEISFHWCQWTPMPSKLACLHTLRVATHRTLRLIKTDLTALGVAPEDYQATNLGRTQEIGAAVEFLGCDGLVAPSARWPCENLILFPDSNAFGATLETVATEDVDWIAWAQANGVIHE